ncbi:RNA recognition motif domain-containing protein [Mucilaginibacter jinjuensis]|uniref:RNA-binding protein n=1 Tax=Mucilaginibacter jinjuensis TaxID=1176721 RepID=A0ABY7TF99_9SPHI|nr:RNA-binding protein [Mucilaginibacter jinjuensis]WCT14408.1 RNA-binding protein [Mucilaginibacter jinjuensis]
MTKLFVVGFPKEMSEIDLDQLFTMHALVRKITVIRDMQTGKSKGYAFVDMMDAPGATRCIEALNGMTFGTRVMSVRTADQKAPEKQQATNRPANFSRNQSSLISSRDPVITLLRNDHEDQKLIKGR